MKFRDDIDPARTWVTSDSHFGHENIKAFCHRPQDIEQTMMEEWARAVPEEDSTLLHLGDLCYRGNAMFKNLVAPHLTGERKLLIMGNHDKQRYSFYRDCGFKLARPFAIPYGLSTTTAFIPENAAKPVTPDLYRIEFSHYPWNPEFDGGESIPRNVIRLHGHIHNNGYSRHAFTPFLRNHINLSVEQTKYRPVNLKELLDAYLLGELVTEGGDWYDGTA